MDYTSRIMRKWLPFSIIINWETKTILKVEKKSNLNAPNHMDRSFSSQLIRIGLHLNICINKHAIEIVEHVGINWRTATEKEPPSKQSNRNWMNLASYVLECSHVHGHGDSEMKARAKNAFLKMLPTASCIDRARVLNPIQTNGIMLISGSVCRENWRDIVVSTLILNASQ